MKKFWQNNKKILGFVLRIFIFWLIAINLLGFVSLNKKTSNRSGYQYFEDLPKTLVFFWNRANFDGIHYLKIAQKGYSLNQQVFFPLYPKIIKTISPLFEGKDLLVGLLISHVSLFLFLCVFYKLILLDFDHKIARRTLIFLLIFPTSFFFGLVYTESLILLLILTSFYAARKNQWLLAGVLGFLASSTRLIGIFLFPALIVEWWEQKRNSNYKLQIINLLSLLLVPLGLVLYMRFLKINFQDPLLFIHSKPFFAMDRGEEKIVLIYQVFWRYLRMVLGTKKDILYFTVWLELFSALGFLYLLMKGYLQKTRLSYLVFSALAFIIPTLVGTFASIPRYVLVMFPCFVALGAIKSTRLRMTLMLVMAIVAIICTSLFFRGYWVA